MSLTTAAAAAKILNEALDLFKTAREQAKRSKDTDLKETLNSLFDRVLDLKQAVLLVTEENNQLRAEREKPTEKPKLKQVGEANYYFAGGEWPYCQPCYDDKKKLVALTPAEQWSGGVRRQCLVCHHFFYEKKMETG
jgi:hypothetical protein